MLRNVHWTLGTAARRDGVRHARKAVKHFAQRAFGFFLLPNIIHACPSAVLRERKPLGNLSEKEIEVKSQRQVESGGVFF